VGLVGVWVLDVEGLVGVGLCWGLLGI